MFYLYRRLILGRNPEASVQTFKLQTEENPIYPLPNPENVFFLGIGIMYDHLLHIVHCLCQHNCIYLSISIINA